MVWIATKTLAAIEAAIEADGGAKFRQLSETTLPKMEDAYRGASSPFRKHLGVSLIGKECARELALSFRWAAKKPIPARLQRLFNRGHLEEARFLAMLLMIDVQLWYETEDGGQYRVSFHNGHMGSALDGIGQNIPDLPNATDQAYTEFKTYNDKQFKELQKKGVQMKSNQHYVQMQVCMYAYNLPYGLYMAVNKNTDELYAEIIELDVNVGIRNVDKGKNIIFTDQMPLRMCNDRSFYKAKFCDMKEVCFGDAMPEINCRTCANSTAEEDGSWSCVQGNMEIFTNQVYEGCSQHLYNPYLLPNAEMTGGNSEEQWISLELPNGEIIQHGPNYITSEELCNHVITKKLR